MLSSTIQQGDDKMPKPEAPPIFIDATKAADILGISPAAIRQLVYRKRIKFTRTGQGRIQFNLNDILVYHAERLGLPSWEANQKKVAGSPFVSTSRAAERLQIAETYVLSLLKKKKLDGYVLADGAVYVSVNSVNAYLKAPTSDTSDL